MACKYLDQSPEEEQACLITGGVCRDWITWFENNKRHVTDRDDFCNDASDDFEPDII